MRDIVRRAAARIVAGCAGLLLSGAAWGQTSTSAPPPASPVPYADYHAHIWSASVAAHRIKPPLPQVQVPPELDRLLRRREQLTGGSEPFRHRRDLAVLYAADAVAMHRSFRNWVRGPVDASIQASLYATLELGERPFHLTPVTYALGDSIGYVAGYVAQQDSAGPSYVGEFHLSLKRRSGGDWLIATESATFPGPEASVGVSAEKLIEELDAAGVRKVVVLSSAYWWGSSILDSAPDERAKTREENEWVARQVAAHRDRLVGFCAFNPLKDYALDEIEWCARNPDIKGIKLHLADANTDLRDPRHVARLRRVFRSANAHRLPIAAHIATQEMGYGRAQARLYLDSIFSAAPDIPIQIAHLAGHGPAHGGDALAFFADAAAAKDPRMKHLYFDVSSNVWSWTSREELALIAKRIRQIGPDHILFGTDWPAGGPDFTASTAWAAFRRLPLTEAELSIIAGNVMPWVRTD